MTLAMPQHLAVHQQQSQQVSAMLLHIATDVYSQAVQQYLDTGYHRQPDDEKLRQLAAASKQAAVVLLEEFGIKIQFPTAD